MHLGDILGGLLSSHQGIVYWRHQHAQWEYEAQSRYWIWLGEYSSYVIINFERGFFIIEFIFNFNIMLFSQRIENSKESLIRMDADGLMGIIWSMKFKTSMN